MNAKGLMLVGLGLAALGGLLTLGSQATASDNGGTSYVFTGLFLVGGINFFRGLYYFSKSQSHGSRAGGQFGARPQPAARPVSSPAATPVKAQTSAVKPLARLDVTPVRLSWVEPDGEHEVYLVDGTYVCAADDCEFESTTLSAAKSHESGAQRHQSSPTKPPTGQAPKDGQNARATTAATRQSQGDSWAAGPQTAAKNLASSSALLPSFYSPALASAAASPAVTPEPSHRPSPTSTAPVSPGSVSASGIAPTSAVASTPTTVPSQQPVVSPLPSAPAAPPVPPPQIANAPSTAPTSVAERAEQPRPKRSRKFIFIAPLLVLLGVGGVLLYQSLGTSNASIEPSASATVSEQRPIPAPQGFTASQGGDGWTTYESGAKGFSIALPEGWRPYVNGEADYALFGAFDRDPSYNIAKNVGSPIVAVTRQKAFLDVMTPHKTFQLFRARYERNPRTIGEVEMYSDHLPAGGMRVFRFTRIDKYLEKSSYTIFWVLHDYHWYLLLFGVSESQASSYLPVFNGIARSLAFE